MLKISITVEETEDFVKTVDACIEAGMVVENTMPFIRLVAGTATPDVISVMEGFPGVMVENDRNA